VNLHSQSYTRNCLLSSLSPDDFALLQPHLERIDLTVRQPLYDAHKPIEYAHFLEGGVASIIARQEDGEEVEVGIVGREGMSGTALLLGAETTPHRSFMQVDGTSALRIGAESLREACRQSETLHLQLLRFVQALTVQAAQTAASNAFYALPERLARWLLMCHDRVEGDDIPLTHEFMSMMLAVRRSGVTVTLHTLEGTGAIRSSRGLVTILSRDRLEEIAGDSYGEPEEEYRRLIGPFGNGQSK
jgi:CRP-like cAMP-binding protein